MNNKHFPGGLWPVMLTPFTNHNEVDFQGLKQLTEFYMQTGAKGLFTNCLSGEMFQLTDSERLNLIQHVVQYTKSKIPVVASGNFSTDIQASSIFIKKIYDCGVDAVVLITNQVAGAAASEDEFKKNVELILQQTNDIPLGLYECPYPYKRLLSPAMMKWLADTGRFYYHKDTSCNLESIKDKLDAITGSRLALYNANTTTALLSLHYGATGISPIGANLYPELYSYLIDHFIREGYTTQLSQLNDQLNMMDAITHQCYPFSAKFFLQKRGISITTQCRISYNKADTEHYLKLEALMKVFKTTARRYNITITKQ